jgi:transcriptional regulator with XRE-family HTH domain
MASPRKDLAKVLGARLDAVRRALGWANNVFAKQIGISEAQWRNYKFGENVIPTHFLLRAIAVTGIRSEFILEDDRSRVAPDMLERIQTAEANPDWEYRGDTPAPKRRRQRAHG